MKNAVQSVNILLATFVFVLGIISIVGTGGGSGGGNGGGGGGCFIKAVQN